MAVEGNMVPIIAQSSLRNTATEEQLDDETDALQEVSDVNKQFSKDVSPSESERQGPQADQWSSDHGGTHGEKIEIADATFSDSGSEKDTNEVMSTKVEEADIQLLHVAHKNTDDLRGAMSSGSGDEFSGEYILTARNRKRLIRLSLSQDDESPEENTTAVTYSYENAKYVQVDLLDSKSNQRTQGVSTAEKAIQVYRFTVIQRMSNPV